MADVRTRRSVWSLAEWDPILLWYAKAVREMQTRPITDPTSWRYQAAIHDYSAGQDPLATHGERLPSASDQRKFWKQCQHGTWFFLPWHRIYLHLFESIVAATIERLGGPAGWALPYWNYSDAADPRAQTLPRAFRDSQLPDGTKNPLRVEQRDPACNSGGVVGDHRDVALDCLDEPTYPGAPTGGSAGFGGPKTVFHHSDGTAGALETVPHGSMHVAVGGDGYMSRFNTAPLDPIFWVHHANVDRLWEVWRNRGGSHVNPADASWLTNVSFPFHDRTGAAVTMTPSQVVDTTVAPLLYKYDDVSEPARPAGVTVPPTTGGQAMTTPIPELVGASQAPVVLRGGRTDHTIAVSAPTGPARVGGAAQGGRRVFLNLENITGAGVHRGYAVYLNVPPGADPREHEDRFVGLMPLFGLAEASDPAAEHGGAGLHYALDATAVVNRLSSDPGWNPAALTVTFVARGEPQAAADVRVGRVSLYNQ